MGWKRNHFERRLRELLAKRYAPRRVYIASGELEKIMEKNPDYPLTELWRILSEYWTLGRAMGKSIPTIQDETEKWVDDIGVQHARTL